MLVPGSYHHADRLSPAVSQVHPVLQLFVSSNKYYTAECGTGRGAALEEEKPKGISPDSGKAHDSSP